MPRRWFAGVFAAVAVLGPSPWVFAQEPEVEAETEGEPEAGEPAEPEAGSELESPRVEPEAEPQRRVAVLLVASSGVDPETADSLTELCIGAVAARGGVTIIGKEEFQSQLGQGEARSMECISSAACLGRVGVELNVEEVVAGTIGRRGETWIFNINRIDIDTGRLAGRAFREVEGDLGALADAVEAAVPQLYEEPSRTATLLVSASVEGAEVLVDGLLVGVYRGEPVQVGEVQPGRHEVSVQVLGYEPWTRAVSVAEGVALEVEASLVPLDVPGEPYVSPLLWIGGALAVTGAGAAVWFGLSSRRTWDGRDNRADAAEFVDARRRDALIANLAMGAAAAGAITAGIGLLLSDFDGEPPNRARVGVTPVAEGTILTVEGQF